MKQRWGLPFEMTDLLLPKGKSAKSLILFTSLAGMIASPVAAQVSPARPPVAPVAAWPLGEARPCAEALGPAHKVPAPGEGRTRGRGSWQSGLCARSAAGQPVGTGPGPAAAGDLGCCQCAGAAWLHPAGRRRRAEPGRLRSRRPRDRNSGGRLLLDVGRRDATLQSLCRPTLRSAT